MGRIKFMVIMAFLPCLLAAPPTSSTDKDMVIITEASTTSTTPSSEKETKEESVEAQKPIITSMDINSNITNRFAHTLVKSKVKNPSKVAQETTFFVVIPDQAYISSFIMEIGGKNYTAYVQEKEKAKKTYEEAVASGISAAHVAVSARDSNKFTVSVNVESEAKAIFYLTYEELLERKFGYYEQIINIHPKQLVKSINVLAEINELRPLKYVKTPSIRSGNEVTKESEDLDPKATITKPENNKAIIQFSPDYAKQKRIAHGLGTDEKEGMAGQFVIQYEVERDPQGGEVLVKDGYFVHFFAPSDLEPLHKHVVFVLDTSGSMYGRRMEQLKEAMKSILGELKPKDFFNLVEFDSNVKVWNLDAPSESTNFPQSEDNWYDADAKFDITDVSFPPAYPVNNNTIKKANKAVEDMNASGGTNIYEALRVGLHLIKLRQKRTNDKDTQPIIFFLTDGEPTVGRFSPESIISGVLEENAVNVPIISLSFGTGADRKFLEKLSLQNKGFARHIYEESDASLQLENFYKEVSSPLLHDVKFTYAPDVTSLTKTEFPILFRGAEFVVAGKIPEGGFKDVPQVSCIGPIGPIILRPAVNRTVGQLERLWAYMTLKKDLDELKVAGDDNKEIKRKALDLALKFSFVTPVTSLVVVKPNASSAVDAEAADGSGIPQYALASGFAGSANRLASLPVHSPMAGFPAPRPYVLSGQNNYVGGGFGGGFAGGAGAAGPPSYSYDSAAPVPQSGQPASGFIALSIPSGSQPSASRPQYPTTPYMPQPHEESVAESETIAEYSTSSTTSTTSTTPPPATLPPQYISELGLGWLEKYLRPDGSLSFFKGNYKLGYNETSPADQECTTPASEEGLCKLIKDCQVLHNSLKTEQELKDNFCIIDDKFAGVCCPKTSTN